MWPQKDTERVQKTAARIPEELQGVCHIGPNRHTHITHTHTYLTEETESSCSPPRFIHILCLAIALLDVSGLSF